MSNVTAVKAVPVSVAALERVGSADNALAGMAETVIEYLTSHADTLMADDATFPAATIMATIHLLATGCTCPVGRGKSCTCGKRPATMRGAAGAQVSTNYGKGTDALRKRVGAAVNVKTPEPGVVRVSLSGEGGGTVVVGEDHPLREALMALFAGEAAAAA